MSGPDPTPRGAVPELALRGRCAGLELRASIDLLGGGLRALRLGDADLVEPYPRGGRAPCCAGAVLFPWPNRVRDGRWTQRGVTYQLPVNEVGLGNAAHGLVGDVLFAVEDHGTSTATISTRVTPTPGYPFRVRLTVTYDVTDDGLTVTSEITNESASPAPVALGHHPYVRIGDVPTDELTVWVDADTYFPTDGQLVPVDELPVDRTTVDLRKGRRVRDLDLNTCYGNVQVSDGRSRHRIAAPDGRSVELWTSEEYGFVQLYRCPDLPRGCGAGPGVGVGPALAIEPMTAPADALNSGRGLRWLEPRAAWAASWGLGPVGAWVGGGNVSPEPGRPPKV